MFELIETKSTGKARAGVLKTAHGNILTPVFMPVGTAASVKTVNQQQLENITKAQIILGNTYHLYLRPGVDILEKAGGLHKFMGWNKPILTDSGGYQIFSLAQQRKLTEDGAIFKSHIDGSKHYFTPENVMDIQRSIGADIIMAFDECPPYPCEKSYAEKSMKLTHRWLKRCVERFNNTSKKYDYEQVLFPIVQGGTFKDLRKQSAEFVTSVNCSGNAIGGLSVGEPADIMYETTELVCEILPKEKPRYLMGVGTPVNILECIALGVDMFDCVMPTRNARHGLLFTKEGIINIKNEKWKNDFSAIEEDGAAETDMLYSKAYLRHLFSCGEILGLQIATLHNLAFYRWLTEEARTRIINGDFYTWKKEIIQKISRKL